MSLEGAHRWSARAASKTAGRGQDHRFREASTSLWEESLRMAFQYFDVLVLINAPMLTILHICSSQVLAGDGCQLLKLLHRHL